MKGSPVRVRASASPRRGRGYAPRTVKSRIRFVPWWPLATAVLLITALSIAVSSGRTIEAVIIGVFVVPTLAFLGLWSFAWKRGLIKGDS
jgi:hypothetical protein